MDANPLPPPPTTRKARSTYEALIDGTRQAIRATGVLSPEQAAEYAAVSTATFYTYFASKDDALAATFDRVLTEFRSVTQELLTIERVLEEGRANVIRSLVRAAVRGFARDANVFGLAIARLGESEVVAAVYRRHETLFLEDFKRFVRLSIAAGQVRDGNVDAMATSILITVQGLQNPLLLRTDVSRVTDEISGMLEALLDGAPST